VWGRIQEGREIGGKILPRALNLELSSFDENSIECHHAKPGQTMAEERMEKRKEGRRGRRAGPFVKDRGAQQAAYPL